MLNKKLILIVFLFFSQIANSQLKIMGFGKLKLGMDISEIIELNPKNDTIEKIYNRTEEMQIVFKNTSRITPIELISDTNFAFNYDYIGCLDKRVRVFHFGKFNINDDITLTDITLMFFKNKLYTIYSSDEKLDELLGNKYGKINPLVKEKEVYFTNGFGNTITKIEKHYSKLYKTNVPNYRCSWLMDVLYDKKGESYIIMNTWLTDSKIENIVTKTEREIEKRSEKREIENKRKKLDNF